MLLFGELRITQNVLGTLPGNLTGHLQTLAGRSIVGPLEQALWPRLEALDWHRQNVFRKA